MKAIGADLVDKHRVEQLWQRYGERFARRILSTQEWAVFSHLTAKTAYLAKRFAAKEAISKALGTGIGQVSFQEIAVLNNENGKPYVKLFGKAAQLAQQQALSEILITLTDEKAYALAFAVAY